MADRSRTAAADDDPHLLAAVLGGDEAAFTELVRRHNSAFLRAARVRMRDRHAAEDVVQETWLAVLRSLRTFEGRGSFRAWALTILGHMASRRLAAEGRTIPFAAFTDDGDTENGRFCGPDHPRWAGMWATTVDSWRDIPEERIESRETAAVIRATADSMPEAQRQVFLLRDVEGWAAAEVSAALGITDGNQRVLLHRARSRVRGALDAHFSGAAAWA